MAWTQQDSILEEASNLHRLARNLEKEIAGWYPVDQSQTSGAADAETASRRRQKILWNNAVEAGVLLFKLCGENAFESQPRVKNLIYHVRGEMRNALDEFKVLCNHQIVNIPYSSGSCLPSYDVYFVKIFEGFCDLWAVSYEDHRAFETYYFATKMRAQLHIRLMDQLGELLKKQFSNEMI